MTKTWDVYHVFGTDEIGRDVLIRLIYGARVSIGVGVLVALVSALVGFLVGALAGYYGGFIDAALMRITHRRRKSRFLRRRPTDAYFSAVSADSFAAR